MRISSISWASLAAVVALCSTAAPSAIAADLKITAANDLDAARPDETIELKWAVIHDRAPDLKPGQITVRDAAGKPLPSQSVDEDAAGVPAGLIFQSSFAPHETKVFTIGAGQQPVEGPIRVFGRFVPERDDDFAWENDRIAFRIYGPALEKVQATGSGVDVWVKRTRDMVVNEFYKRGDYHKDHGHGMDCYDVGTGRGCGGTGIWKDGKYYTSLDFRAWKILENGPVRFTFELTYIPWDAGGTMVSETKRISLDAGSNMNHFRSVFNSDQKDLTVGIGLNRHDPKGESQLDREHGWASFWGKPDKNAGLLGTGLVVDPALITDMTEDRSQILTLVHATAGTPLSFYAGPGWDRSGDFPDRASWDSYVRTFARRVASPIRVTCSAP